MDLNLGCHVLEHGDTMGVSDETLLWVFVALTFFCVLIVFSLLWISQITYKRMLSKIDLDKAPLTYTQQAPLWTYTKETTYYDNPNKKEPPPC